ncbi:hypothetical protein EV13_2961 [Prochlorococcus sp. MIT 0702]|nr:hypothetical protein EV13_2961 [Prochlorococcus sp. MIT 0702]
MSKKAGFYPLKNAEYVDGRQVKALTYYAYYASLGHLLLQEMELY